MDYYPHYLYIDLYFQLTVLVQRPPNFVYKNPAYKNPAYKNPV